MGDTNSGPGVRGTSAGGSCGNLPAALTSLADQVTVLKNQLVGATEQVHWTGPAAAAFREHATARYGMLTQLIHELTDSAATARSLQCLVGAPAP